MWTTLRQSSRRLEAQVSKEKEWIKVPCLRVRQPIGTFYSCSIPCQDLLQISYADVRKPQDSLFEKVTGIQREPSPSRVRELKQYVQNVDATFPTSIIVAIDGDNVRIEEGKGELRIRKEPNVATILDGQHRLAGLEGCNWQFELNVAVFVDMDIQDQAMTFGTINLAQTKVNRSLVFDLYGYQKKRSPYKTCHTIARLMNKDKDSPLYLRIKILGKATGEDLQFITQATFVTELVKYVSSDPMLDRNLILQGHKLEPASGAAAQKLIFQPFFHDDADEKIVRILWDYFDVVAARWPEAWDSDEKGMILNRTTGFTALMKFLGYVYRSKRDDGGSLSKKAITEVFRSIRLSDADFNSSKYLPGGEGVSTLLADLRSKSGLD